MHVFCACLPRSKDNTKKFNKNKILYSKFARTDHNDILITALNIVGVCLIFLKIDQNAK